jgi:hypothetical protein
LGDRPRPPFAIAVAAGLAALGSLQLALWLMLAAARAAAGGGVAGFDAGAALAVALVVCARAARGERAARRALPIAAALWVATWALALPLAAGFDDLSWDGQTYHALALSALHEGWNPNTELLAPDRPPRTWVNHYPRGPWLWAAGLQQSTGSYACGKAVTLALAVFAAAAVAQATWLSRRGRPAPALALGALAAANPVIAVQFPTLYVDGLVAGSVTVALAAAWSWTTARSSLALLALCSASLLLPNLKFTGLLFATAIAGGVALSGGRRHARTALAPLAAIALGAIGPGFAPYMTNLIRGDHLLHPALGERRLEILGSVTPPALAPLAPPARLLVSLASETANACPSCPQAEVKWPFVVRSAELRDAALPDARTGGFGPLFSGALLLTALLLAVGRTGASRGAGAVAVLFGLAVATPGAWWARLVPFLWLVPIAAIALLPPGPQPALIRRLALALALVTTLDAALVASTAIGQAAIRTRRSRAELQALARSGPLLVRPDAWPGALQRLRDAGASFHEAEFAPAACRAVLTLPYADAVTCSPHRD